MSVVKIAEDRYQNKLQFAHIKCGTAKNITTSQVWDADGDRHVVITPTSVDAYVCISAASSTPTGTGDGDSLGKFIPFGGSYTTIIRKGEYIGASASVNVVSLGEL
jgi:hypothetical protein|tara:strand:- start:5574 stop:5891 length:318 start_codon:yes stop_codon:yes gene_type:complete